jgi:flagellar hook-associated protein 2
VSGLVSGIDWDTTIKQLMQIERRRTTLLEDRRDENSTKLNLWAQIQTKVQSLQTSMEGMDQRSEFAVKSASSSDSSIVSIAASASAAVGAHTVEVLQLAKAHRIAAQGWADKNATGVGDSGGNFVIQIDDKTITIDDADLSSATTLEEMRNLINSDPENDGLITASIVDDGSGTNRYRLVLTADNTGVDNQIRITGNPTTLNFSTNVIDAAETQVGWSGSSALTSGGTYSGTVNKSFSFTIAGSGAQTVGSGDITVNWADSVGGTGSFVIPNGYAGTAINVAEGVQMTFGAGTLTGGDSFSVDAFTPTLSAAQDARIKFDGIYMNKSSNTISDVLEGVTLNLRKAEPNTNVELSVSNDTATVTSRVQNFVDSYNSLVTDLATFSAFDDTNKVAAPLLGDGFLSTVRARLTGVTSEAMQGLPNDARLNSLALVGIKSGNNGVLSIDSAKLSDALENHFDDVVGLFTQSFLTQDSKIGFVTANEKTTSGDYTLQVNYDAAGNVTGATINGKAATIDGGLIHGAKGTSAEGLVMSFTSPGSGAGTVNTTIRFGKGLAGTLSSEAIKINDTETGPIHYATQALNDSNDMLNKQIAAWDERLKATETDLRRQYARLESLISQMKNQSSSISAALS